MKLCLLVLLTVSSMFAQDKIKVFGQTWLVPSAADWKISDDAGSPILQLLVGREPAPGPRKPCQFALMQIPAAIKMNFEADVRPTKRSLIIVYAYQDTQHFNYVHFSTDAASKQPVHNGVFHVYGGERVRISSALGSSAFTGINKWFHVRVVWDGMTGDVQGYVDGIAVPALHAVDLSLTAGQIGIGSFDETGDFKNVKVETATDAKLPADR